MHPANQTEALRSPPRSEEALLRVSDLTVDIQTETGPIRAVDGVSFDVGKGEVLGIVGESGSGKSITALSILRLLPERAEVASGRVEFGDRDLLTLGHADLRAVRGRLVSMVFQDPLSSLNPLMTVGRQLVETVRLHDRTVPKPEAQARAGDLLAAVGFADPGRVLRSYPHELSGGMRQRAVIVMAMINHPDLIIADEPTTALDVTTQAQVLDSLEQAREVAGSAMILISHDLGLVSERAGRVSVMYHGKIVETGTTDEALQRPSHPYTIGLLNSRPTLQRRRRLDPIPGGPPGQFDVLGGCSFAPRCAHRQNRCDHEVPVLRSLGTGRTAAACHFAEQAATAAAEPSAWGAEGSDGAALAREPGGEPAAVLAAEGLTKDFGRGRHLFGKTTDGVRAVDTVSFTIDAGQTLALVGESGSGKSTLARLVLRLIEPTSGRARFLDRDIMSLRGGPLRDFRAQAQLVQQDPFSALNPRMTVGEAIGEPLRVHRSLSGRQAARRVTELLESVGLRAEHARRFPHEFSGGQRQRICIARALSLDPQLLVLDEPVSSLDVSIQAQILNLLAEIQRDRRITYLFITHDLAVVQNVADRVAVLYRGTVVEKGLTDGVLSTPRHPYTQLLLAAVPGSRRAGSPVTAQVTGEGDRAAGHGGCPFLARCPKAQAVCADQRPALAAPTADGNGQLVACHFPVSQGTAP